MVRLVGFEPTTYGLEVRCSIQLSYRRMHSIQGRHLALILRRIFVFMKNNFHVGIANEYSQQYYIELFFTLFHSHSNDQKFTKIYSK